MNKLLLTAATFTQAYILFPLVAKAEISPGLSGASANLDNAAPEDTSSDLPTLIGNIINVFLSVLGILCIAFVVYAGILYLTAGGEEENVKKARKLLTNAVIGMVLVVAAYAIATFVIDALVEVAT